MLFRSAIGAFLDWGLEKDLFVPFKEQHRKLVEGEHAVAYLYRDEVTDRLLASTKISKWLEKTSVNLLYNTQVDLLCFEEIEIGFRVIINEKHQGIIYKNEVFQPIEIGEQMKGYVRFVRENGHVDVSLTPMGYKKVSTLSETVLEAIVNAGGFLPLHDKSDASIIQSKLGMSKKAFKQTVGVLYKSKQIMIEETGIRKL